MYQKTSAPKYGQRYDILLLPDADIDSSTKLNVSQMLKTNQLYILYILINDDEKKLLNLIFVINFFRL